MKAQEKSLGSAGNVILVFFLWCDETSAMEKERTGEGHGHW